MEKKSEDFSMEEAVRLSKTSAGQQLLRRMKAADSPALRQAAAEANKGNYRQAGRLLADLAADPEIQSLLRQLGREKNG